MTVVLKRIVSWTDNISQDSTTYLLVSVIVVVAFIVSTAVATAGPHPNMYVNQAEIDAIQNKVNAKIQPWAGAYFNVISAANSALKNPVLSVTYQGDTSNRYHTDKPYCGWTAVDGQSPDCRDGQIAPGTDRGDYEAAIQLSATVRDLGLGYALTGQSKYADKAIEMIRAWSLNSDTHMTPTTAAENRIELFITLPGYFYGADLIWNYGGWNASEKAAFTAWVKKVGEHGMANGAGSNNFANWRVVLIATAGALLDNDTMLNFAATEWKRLVPLQMNNSGRMSWEYERTKGLHYSLYAVNAMIQGAEILFHRNINLYDYNNNGKSLELALDYITPYAIDPASWPYKQITTITQDDSMALYELAYSYYQKQDYLDAINQWGRPMEEIRVMGINTLTHANPLDVGSSSTSSFLQNFETYVDGTDPVNWRDSGANSSMSEDNSLFRVFTVGADKVFGTTSTASNIHSHYYGANLVGLSGYEYSGRFMMTSATSGVGITFFSQFLNRDAYYRLRRYGNNPTLHLSPHGTTVSGDIDTGISPAPNQWYRFRIQVENTGMQTDIRARVWLDGASEPLAWQVRAFDNSATRLTSGTVGLWSYQSGRKYWDDLEAGPVGLSSTITVPGVVGLSQTEAESSITAADLSIGAISNNYSDTVAAGFVISQQPASGQSIASGASVDLVISLGPLIMINVPDVVGLLQVEAENSLASLGLSVGTISNTYIDTSPPGSVIVQNPAAGTPVFQASPVDLVVSSGTSIILQDFETYADGADPVDWRDSGANNSLLEENSLFQVVTVGIEKVFGTASTASNIHSHYNGTELNGLSAYEYSGRFMLTSANSGVGITFFSQYPAQDAYYRLRRYANNPTLHLSPHGTTISGDIDTGISPALNQWYRFRIQVEDTDTQTDIRAKVWLDGASEPFVWQVQAFDNSATRLSSGTVGLWSYLDGGKFWDNLVVGPLQ